MGKYNIAGVIVEMNPKYDRLKQQSTPYAVSDDIPAQMKIGFSDNFLESKREKNPALTIGECEYLWLGFDFYRKLPAFDGMLLHSSCIAVDGYAYLFSAACGTGKSTHTSLWKKRFGDRAVYVNDDKPALRIIDGEVYACGTPFSGKTDLNTNISVPLKGICLLSRGEKNSIVISDARSSIPKLLNQMCRPEDPAMMAATMNIMSRILDKVPVYDLFCNISDEAVDVSYNAMSRKV